MSKKKQLTIITEGAPDGAPAPRLIWPRPSSFNIAEKCTRAPWLSVRYREQNAATEAGDTSDAYVSLALIGGGEPPAHAKEAIALLAWVRENFPADAQFYVQRKVFLIDPLTGEMITEGTPDLLVLFTVEGRRRLVVVDWKSIGQLWAGYLPAPDANLQQLIYMVAAGMDFDVDEAQIILVCFDERGVKPIKGQIHPQDAWWSFLDRIRAVPRFDPEGPEPTAVKGAHCATCWQRMHCSAYLLPAIEGAPPALMPFMGEGQELTDESALTALDWLDQSGDAIGRAMKLRERVREQLEAFVTMHGPVRKGDRQWGPIATTGARRGATVAELEELGLTNLIKAGKPGVKFDWQRVALPAVKEE